MDNPNIIVSSKICRSGNNGIIVVSSGGISNSIPTLLFSVEKERKLLSIINKSLISQSYRGKTSVRQEKYFPLERKVSAVFDQAVVRKNSRPVLQVK